MSSTNINSNDNNGYKSQISMTPTIQEELDEEVEYEKNAEKEMLRKSKENLRNSRYISSSSSARLLPHNNNNNNSTSNTNLISGGSLVDNPLRSNSTITFEKIKVIPRPRTQSEQSILSSLSLKSLLDNKIKNKTQINDNSSSTSNKGNIPKEAQIGFQEPFTDDNRIEIDSNIQPSIVTHSPLDLSGSLLKDVPTDIGLIIPSSESVTKTVQNNVSQGKNSVVIGSDNDDTEEIEASQNLTTQALRKLSMLKMGEQNLVDPNESEEDTFEQNNTNQNNNNNNNNNNIPTDKTEVATMKDPEEEEDDDETLKLGRSESNFTATVQPNVQSPRNLSPSPPVAPPPSIRHELPRIQEQLGSSKSIHTQEQANTPRSTYSQEQANTPRSTHAHTQEPPETPRSTHINSKVNAMTLKDNSIHNGTRQIGSNNKISLMRQPQSTSGQQLPFGSTKLNLYNGNTSMNPHTFDKNATIKQINNPKKPLYVPAVLRNVTETNLTSADLRDQSDNEDMDEDGVSGIIGNDTMSSNGSARDYLSMYSHNGTTSLDNHLMKRRGQRTTTQSSIHSTASSIYSAYRQRFQDMLGTKPGDTMTRAHWIPDSERDSCHECHVKFGLLERKHHCRHCGEIFCQRHVMDKIYLNADAQFCQLRQFGGGVLVKVCHGCYIANDEYMQAIKLKKLKQMEEQNDTVGEMMPMGRRRNGHRGIERNRRESIAGSVPVDWNWSSF